MTEVLAFDPKRTTNAQLMRDCHRLGYLDGSVLDVTWGTGRFWEGGLLPDVAHDLFTNAPDGKMDFTNLLYNVDQFDVVVFDPPYKLNGTPTHALDANYGVGEKATVHERMEPIYDGCREAARVARKRVLVKCQDQVVSGAKVWQTHEIASYMDLKNWRLKDRLEVSSYRQQPEGRRQLHARQTTSSLLVFVPQGAKR